MILNITYSKMFDSICTLIFTCEDYVVSISRLMRTIFAKKKLTGRCIHSSTVANDYAITVEPFSQCEESVLHLYHCFQ